MPKLDPETKQRIERFALRIYDRMNPDYMRKINVSKAHCIKLATQTVLRHQARSKPCPTTSKTTS